MPRSNSFHGRYCATSDTEIASLFVVACALETFLSWRDLHASIPYGFFDIMTSCFGILASIWLFVLFKCIRERIVVGIVLVRSLAGALAGFTSVGAIDSVGRILKPSFLGLWALAGCISVSMLVSSVQRPRIVIAPDDRIYPKQQVVIFGGVVLAAMIIGALIYFVPRC